MLAQPRVTAYDLGINARRNLRARIRVQTNLARGAQRFSQGSWFESLGAYTQGVKLFGAQANLAGLLFCVCVIMPARLAVTVFVTTRFVVFGMIGVSFVVMLPVFGFVRVEMAMFISLRLFVIIMVVLLTAGTAGRVICMGVFAFVLRMLVSTVVTGMFNPGSKRGFDSRGGDCGKRHL